MVYIKRFNALIDVGLTYISLSLRNIPLARWDLHVKSIFKDTKESIREPNPTLAISVPGASAEQITGILMFSRMNEPCL